MKVNPKLRGFLQGRHMEPLLFITSNNPLTTYYYFLKKLYSIFINFFISKSYYTQYCICKSMRDQGNSNS